MAAKKKSARKKTTKKRKAAKRKAAKRKATKKRATKKRAAASQRDTADVPKERTCFTMRNHERLMRDVRGYMEARARCEEHAWRAAMSPMVGRTGCTKIPVVVHVVHRTAAENISQAQIDSQITVLNEDFRLKNANAGTIPMPFMPLAEDARIEFELATTDPDGNPTNGVTRTPTNVPGFSGNDDVKRSATGGADPWPADRYLNIWVCRLLGGLLGYAQFPGGPAATDGVVITHTGFGTTGTAAAPFNLGRTATHEIGHWLNLMHIWGDDGTSCFGSDNVADTPNQAGPNTGVPTFPSITCSNGPNGDMFMNYMDYTDDAGMSMFTRGQVARMQAALDGPRSSIGTATPCGKALPKEMPKELPKEMPKELPKEMIKEMPKDLPKDPPKDPPKDLPKDPPKDPPKDLPKDPPKDFPKDPPKDPPKDLPKDPPKDFPKDPPKDFPKDPPKDFPFDPGPKPLPFDPGPKFFDPGPKVFDPGPKFFDPGPKFFDPGPFPFPFPFLSRGATPFVLATGTGAGGSGGGGCQELAQQHAALQAQHEQLKAQYMQLLAQYQALGGGG